MQNFTFLNKKGFVFLFELLIAIGLATAFLNVASFQELETGELLTKIQEKQRSTDILTTLDENGFLLQKLDENASADDKMLDIYNEILRQLPETVNARIELDFFDVDTADCKTNESFESCFNKIEGTYNPQGPELPNDKSVTAETLILVKKQPPQLCEVVQPPTFQEKETEESLLTKTPLKIYFSEEEKIAKPLKLFFSHQEGHDANVIFDLNTTPETSLQCGENLRFDLGAKVIDFGRNPVDIMLVQDRSGSMDEFTVNLQTLASGAFNDGTRQCGFLCLSCTPTNWQNLAQFDLTSGQDYAVKMVDHNHSGARPCLFASTPPYLELENPSGSQPTNRDTEVILRTPFVSGTYTAWGWSQEWIGYDLNLYENKMTASQRAAKNFVDDAEWKDNDRLGLVSFAGSSDLDEQLQLADDQNKEDIKDAIDALNSGGSTAIGEGIDEATDELLGTRFEETHTKFQIVLSDGQNNSGTDPLDAAQRAADENIVIYTIAFGQDADQDTLREIAEITDGNFYYADEDENALDDIYDVIRDDIGNRAGGKDSWAYDANLTVPVNMGADVISTGTGGVLQESVDRNYIFYDIGDISPSSPWNDFFTINYPCDRDLTCSVKSIHFPEEPFYLEYDNQDGSPGNPLIWDENADLNFEYRDLTVDILSAKIVAAKTVFLDVNAINSGHLNTSQTTMDFYLDDPETGTFLKQTVVPAMCGQLGSGCSNYFTLFLDELVEEEGFIYVIIDNEDNVAECPGNNVAEIFCSTGPKTQYFVLKLWTWPK